MNASRLPGAASVGLMLVAAASCTSHSSTTATPAGTHSPVSAAATTEVSAAPTGPGSDSAAALACRKALGEGVVSAMATTVGAVRAWSIGPTGNDLPAAHAFPDDPDDAFAAWCWVGSDGQFASWGVDGHGAKTEFGTVNHAPGDSSTPSGPIGIGS